MDEELVTSSDGQSHDSEAPIHSSVEHTPQVSEFLYQSIHVFIYDVIYNYVISGSSPKEKQSGTVPHCFSQTVFDCLNTI